MIIDVIDLNFKALNFNRRYDRNRYNRGKMLFRIGCVQVQNVDKIGVKIEFGHESVEML